MRRVPRSPRTATPRERSNGSAGRLRTAVQVVSRIFGEFARGAGDLRNGVRHGSLGRRSPGRAEGARGPRSSSEETEINSLSVIVLATDWVIWTLSELWTRWHHLYRAITTAVHGVRYRVLADNPGWTVIL